MILLINPLGILSVKPECPHQEIDLASCSAETYEGASWKTSPPRPLEPASDRANHRSNPHSESIRQVKQSSKSWVHATSFEFADIGSRVAESFCKRCLGDPLLDP